MRQADLDLLPADHDCSAHGDRKFVRTARRYRTIEIQVGPHTITAADLLPDDLHHAIETIARVADLRTNWPNSGQARIRAHSGNGTANACHTAEPASVPPASTRATQARSNSAALIATVNARHSSDLNASTGPPGSLESRTATSPGTLSATSTRVGP